MLGRFLLQLQVQMKTSLEIMNMNATYEIRSQHTVDFQNKAISIVIRRSILYIHFLVEFSLKYIKNTQIFVILGCSCKPNTTIKFSLSIPSLECPN